ncbi:unnamed protein product [Aspergillus oryzae]|uniref:Altered inheritance of mitochondria protein 24, mitochondrial n=1 Tax=Aspergillus oryzae TaxID=5062 RepID=A0AAN4YQ93_ASPOZ|nr:unnamed protein product [Aspergillus oryzae]
MFSHLILVTCFIIPAARAGGWDNFTDNLATDLSVSLLDNVIFALAPLGILTAAVSAIRVCGNASLRAFIGRAQEGPGEAEHELLSCVSETTAELFNNGGISRVFGRPRLLEVVVWKDKDPVTKEDCWKTGTLRDALLQRAWTTKDEGLKLLEKDYPLPELEIPNLSLNKGIARRSQGWFYCAAAKITDEFSGVLVYSAVTVLLYPDQFQKDDQPVESYALPLFLIGTICLCTGMFLCAFIIERSSKEFYFHPVKPSKIYWLQPGGQNVGDQVFDSFLAVNEGSSSQLDEGLVYIKSIRDHKLQSNSYILALTISFTLVGFVAQFVGLRGLHASVTLAQLGSTLMMAIIRTCLRTKRISSKENRLTKHERNLTFHKNQELDCFAFHLEDARSFSLVSGIVRGSSSYQPSLLSVTSGSSGQDTRLGTKLVQTRAHLARLTSGTDRLQASAWDEMPIRQVARNLAQTIEMTMDLISTWQHALKDIDSFELDFVCQSHHKFIAPKLESYTINLARSDDTLQWRVEEHELEAVLGLWTWSLLNSSPEWLQNGLGRLVGLSESEARAEDTDLYFHKWIFRQREARMVSTKMVCLPQCMFGFFSGLYPNDKEILVVKTENRLETMAAQDIYVQFIRSVFQNMGELGGDTNVISGSRDGYVAHNNRLDDLVNCFEASNLGSREDALLCLVPGLRHRGLLPMLSGGSSVVKSRIKELTASRNWVEAFSILWWLCERSEGEEFELSVFELGCLCRRAILQTDPNIQAEGYKYACRLIENDPRTRFIRSLRDSRPTDWMDADQRPEQWKAFSLQLGWVIWHITQKISDRQGIQSSLESLGIHGSSVPIGKANGSENQGKKGEQAVLHWLTNNDEGLYSRELLSVDDRLALDWLCQNRHHALLDWLIARWVELEERCPGFLYHITIWAVEGKYRVAIDALRRRGVSINMQNPKDGSTPLIDKIMAGDRKAIQELLDAGADVNGSHSSGGTPLSVASHKGDLETVSLLLRKGSRVNIQDSDGFSPLMYATEGGHVDIVRVLLQRGANANLGSFGGSTPLMAAAADNRVEILELLLSRGAETLSRTGPSLTFTSDEDTTHDWRKPHPPKTIFDRIGRLVLQLVSQLTLSKRRLRAISLQESQILSAYGDDECYNNPTRRSFIFPPPQRQQTAPAVSPFATDTNATAYTANGDIGNPYGSNSVSPPPQSSTPPAAVQPQAAPVVSATSQDEVGTFNGGSYRISHRDTNSVLTMQLAMGCPIEAKPGGLCPSHRPSPETNAFLAKTSGVEKDYKSQGMTKAVFSGEGFIIYHMSGVGLVWLQSFGAIIRKDVSVAVWFTFSLLSLVFAVAKSPLSPIQIPEGKTYLVDNGYIVAWNCKYKIERAASGGLLSAFSSSEGLACKFEGPGTVYLQTRNAAAFAAHLSGK